MKQFFSLVRSVALAAALFCAFAFSFSHSAAAAPQTAPIINVDSLGDSNSKDGVITLREALLIDVGGTDGGGLNRTLDNGEKSQLSGCYFSGSNDDWSIIGGCGLGVSDHITFSLSNCPCTIAVNSDLPHVPPGTNIDGYTTPGSSLNTSKKGFNAQIMIRLDGLNAGDSVDGLTIFGDGAMVQGLEIYGFRGHGIVLNGNSDIVQGNLVDQNAADGIVSNGLGNQIGGDPIGQRNTIYQNGWHGVELFSPAGGTSVDNNLIGISPAGGNVASGNTFSGISIYSSQNQIKGNQIAFNHDNGILVLSGTQTYFYQNSIYSNSKLGIDLGNDGVTLNDKLDADTGANNLQNYPVVNSATAAGKTVQGKMSGKPNTTIEMAFYKSPSCDASGYGEGKTYIGYVVVTTNGKGVASFNGTLQKKFKVGNAITVTAAGGEGTSEFSKCITAK